MITLLIAGLAFLHYMSPEVTLEDSGELVTGAFNFGVPHPPGYPLWAFLGWVWRHFVPFGNPAYRICLMSVVTGALVVGVLTLLMTRSIMMLLRSVSWAQELEDSMRHWIALTIGSTSALMFGFNRGVWLWACVPEMRVLNVFMFIITACTFFAWMMRPQRHGFLYATILLYALGIANHQTILVMAGPFMVAAFAVGVLSVWDRRPVQMRVVMPALSAFWELSVAGLFSAGAGFLLWAWLETNPGHSLLDHSYTWRTIGAVATAVALMFFFGQRGWLNWKRSLICTAMFFAGAAFYFYMPVASSTNPPMNWGYSYTKQGFLHHIQRGQYERLHFSLPWTTEFWIQTRLFSAALLQQFSPPLGFENDFWLGLPIVLFAFLTLWFLFFRWKELNQRAQAWLIFVLAAFLTTSFGLLTIINPGLDKQNQEINIKFFAPGHGFFVMMIGYGMALTVAWVLARWKNFPRVIMRVFCAALLLLPVIPYLRNIKICNQRDHDFGYQFGYRMFKPGGGYPDMDKDAVLYGGTDPGRFVPTYMIFVESQAPPHARTRMAKYPESADFDRRDVYIITQSALADRRYAESIRDHYGVGRPDPRNPETMNDRPGWQRMLLALAWEHLGRDQAYPKRPIWIPGEADLETALRQYLDDLRGRQPLPGEEVKIENGHVSVQGVTSVMAVNGFIAKAIFDHNKEAHTFYVEESYMIPWMYPYLEPYGTILKINNNPIPALTPEMVARDRAYWDALFGSLRNDPRFQRDDVAQKTFSKLRSTIGGLYAFRHMTAEAEYAYQQAIALCPDSPEGSFRLAQLYVDLGRFDDGVAVLEEYRKHDRYNARVPDAIETVQRLKIQSAEQRELERQYAAQPGNLQLAQQLIESYSKRQRVEAMDTLVASLVSRTDLPAEMLLQIAQAYIPVGKLDRATEVLTIMTQRYPQAQAGWYNLAVVECARKNCDEAIVALEHALSLDDPSHRVQDSARHDPRLDNCRQQPRFAQMMSQPTHP